MTADAERELLTVLQNDLAAQRRERSADRRITRELLHLLRDHRETSREVLELLRLLRQDLSRKEP